MAPQASARYGCATIAQLYTSAFRACPQALALVEDGVTLTYEALARRSYRMARLFHARGLERQDVVAFLVGNRVEAVVAIIAAQLAGLKAVSLHPMASEEDHAFVLADAGVKALVIDDARFAARAGPAGACRKRADDAAGRRRARCGSRQSGGGHGRRGTGTGRRRRRDQQDLLYRRYHGPLQGHPPCAPHGGDDAAGHAGDV